MAPLPWRHTTTADVRKPDVIEFSASSLSLIFIRAQSHTQKIPPHVAKPAPRTGARIRTWIMIKVSEIIKYYEMQVEK